MPLRVKFKTLTDNLNSVDSTDVQQRLAVQLKNSINYFNPQDNPVNSQPSLAYQLKTITMNSTSNANTMLVQSIGQSSNNILGKVNNLAKYSIDTTGFLNTTQHLTLNRGIVAEAQRLVNHPKFLESLTLLSSNAPLQMTSLHRQALLATMNQTMLTAQGLAKTGNVHTNATTEILRSDSERAIGNSIIGNQLQGGMNFVEKAMRDGHSTSASIKALARESGMEAYLPTDEIINKKLSTYNIQSVPLTRKDIEEGMYGGLTRVIKEQGQSGNSKVDKTISAGLLGLGISKVGEFGSTLGRAYINEYAGFMKNTIGNGYDYGSPFGNVIQQQSNVRQAGISIVASGIGAIIGGVMGGGAGAFVGGAVGSAFGSMASAIGGGKDTLQAQAHAEYDQQEMMMQTLFATRPDLQPRIDPITGKLSHQGMGMFGGRDVDNILSVMTPTRMMVAKGGISVNNQLSDSWINSTAKEAVASNMSYSQSETYGYNKAVIGRYPGGSALDLGRLAKSANVDVSDLAQRTLDYVPFTRGNITSASDFAQRSFSQPSGYTAKQLSAGNEGYLANWQKSFITRQFQGEDYLTLMNDPAKLKILSKQALSGNPTALAETNFINYGPGDAPYYTTQKLSPSTSLKPTQKQNEFMDILDVFRPKAWTGQVGQGDLDKKLNEFEKGLSGSTVRLRDWIDTVDDLGNAFLTLRKNINDGILSVANGSTGSQ